MLKQQYPSRMNDHTQNTSSPGGGAGSDEAFLQRQFRSSIEALERVHALEPGDFERLIQIPARTPEERDTRAAEHEAIARKALIAAQQGLIAEEDFNIWSGRRKENGEPVKIRFEEAFGNARTPRIACQRGALTGIVRAYMRLQDDLINRLIHDSEFARTGDELLAVEKEAINCGFLDFELYANEKVNGWPSFPRSTGRFRGATRLRQFFEKRQLELELSPESAARQQKELVAQDGRKQHVPARAPKVAPEHRADNASPAPLSRLFTCITRLFK